jgi:hypothetical protein
MKFPIAIFCTLLGLCVAATAQIELTSNNYFPAELEFHELQKILSEESFEAPDRLHEIEDGRLILDVGFEKYDRRVYSIGKSDEVAIEVITLKDFRAAYALLTLLRSAGIKDGPPGDAYTITTGSIRFIRDRYWIRIRGQNASEDLLKRIALSVSNRIGPSQQKPPSLISHFPEPGYDASSLRYFPGLQSFKSYSDSEVVKSLNIVPDAEIAQANYSVDNQPGILFLVNFPTGQVADEYFSAFGNTEFSLAVGAKTYAKKIGPIVAILNGPIDSAAADKFLGALRYSYSIRWVYEKRNNSKIIWGIPVSILGTVVRSMFFIAILCVISVISGTGFAVLRFFLRGHGNKNAPDQPEQTEITRLRLR